jgi:hypothetical protein
MGGNMNRRIIGRVARFIVNLCDFMNGYIGKLIENFIIIAVTDLITVTAFSMMMITLS